MVTSVSVYADETMTPEERFDERMEQFLEKRDERIARVEERFIEFEEKRLEHQSRKLDIITRLAPDMLEAYETGFENHNEIHELLFETHKSVRENMFDEAMEEMEALKDELFEKAGWKIRMISRNYFPEIDDPQLSISICRPQEMSRYIEDGMLDAGITGKDWTLENGSEVEVIEELVYSKVSKKPTRWVIAVPGDSDITRIEELEGKRISTELVNVTRRFFEERGINVDISFSWGATEAKAVSGLADAIVEVTETETTIRAHGLRIIHELMQIFILIFNFRDFFS